MNSIRIGLAALCMSLLAACSTPRNAAPVVDRTTTARPVEAPRPLVRNENRGTYMVRRGDTLNKIASEQGVSARDLSAWNNIANPNDIKVDQVLRLTPPESQAQPGSIATGGNVDVRPLPGAVPGQAGTDKNAPHKTGPRGEKRPYSEAILADMQKPDTRSDLPTPQVAVAPPKPPGKPAEGKPLEKPQPAPSAEQGGEDEALAWIWPTEGKIVTNFDEAKSKGIDIAGKIGQQVVAASGGKVIFASGIRGYGNLVIVKHNDNLLSAYAHNQSILVKQGQTVSKGQKIAEMGKSDSDAVKLHFEIRRQGKPVDPTKFLPNR